MLNDIAWPTRLLLAGFGLSVGVMLGGPVVGASASAGSALLFAGLGIELLLVLAVPLVTGRADKVFRDRVVAATAEIASGAVVPVPAVGRVVRRRVVALPWWLPGRGSGPGKSGLTVFTALADGPARRVAALVPADLGLSGRGVPAVLLVHPREREVAVLDDRVTTEHLAAVQADPRWRGERLPTDRTVVGGYAGLLLAPVVGGGLGIGLATLVVTLAT